MPRPYKQRARQPLFGRWLVKVGNTDANGCWPWRGALTKAGYGQLLGANRAGVFAHRMSYEFYVGPIPDGHQIDHLCGNRACVNPDHLEAVTPALNSQRGIGKITMEIAREIRESSESGAAVARRFGISPGTVSHIRTGRTWREPAA